jgi:DNA modification methylase
MVNVSKDIEQVSIEKLIPYAKNSRTHSDAQVAQVSGSIKEFGFTNPVLIDQDGVIIAGHGRVLAARKLGMSDVPCIRLTHLSDTQKRAYVIADNKLALNAGWDDELLAIELKDLQDFGFDLGLTGFTHDELNKLMPDPVNVGLTDEDECPEVSATPVTKLGDVWLLGKHRLMCGDSTSIDNFDVLVKEQADMIFTDPPYGMSYGGGRAAGSTKKGALVKAHGMIKNDDLAGDNLIALIRDAIATSSLKIKEGAALYACFTWRTYSEFEKALESAGHSVKTCIVWDKKSIGLGNSNYRPQHEFIFYCGGSWYGDKSESDVWYLSRGNTSAYVHPTQKPVELIERALNNSSKKGDIVIDCFGGSGSTLIACEKTGRINRSMELDEKYVDVIVKRWQNFTGGGATLEGDGRTFNEIAENETRQNTQTN